MPGGRGALSRPNMNDLLGYTNVNARFFEGNFEAAAIFPSHIPLFEGLSFNPDANSCSGMIQMIYPQQQGRFQNQLAPDSVFAQGRQQPVQPASGRR